MLPSSVRVSRLLLIAYSEPRWNDCEHRRIMSISSTYLIHACVRYSTHEKKTRTVVVLGCRAEASRGHNSFRGSLALCRLDWFLSGNSDNRINVEILMKKDWRLARRREFDFSLVRLVENGLEWRLVHHCICINESPLAKPLTLDPTILQDLPADPTFSSRISTPSTQHNIKAQLESRSLLVR